MRVSLSDVICITNTILDNPSSRVFYYEQGEDENLIVVFFFSFSCLLFYLFIYFDSALEPTSKPRMQNET